jgi:hypothetical protein
MLTLSGLTHFVAEVADDATAISIKPANANEADADIVETLVVTPACGDAKEIVLTHKKPVVLPDDSFCKVTENLADFSGTYLIVYEGGNLAFDGSLDDAIDTAGNSVAVTIENNAIKATAELGESIFTIAKVDGGYTIQSASGYYLGRTQNDNGMDESTTIAHKNTIEISNGVAVIKTANYTPSLQYYKSGANSRFRYYKSGQQAVQLYKLNGEIPEGTTPDPEQPGQGGGETPEPGTGETKTVTYTVESTSSVSVSGEAPAGATVSYKSTYSSKCQLTGGNSMTLTLTGFDGKKITGLTLSMKSNSSKGAGSLSVNVGAAQVAAIADSKFNTAAWYGAWSTSYVDVTPTVTAQTVGEDESIVITIEATANSLYCESFTLTYE